MTNMKTVDMQDLVGAEVIEVTVGLPATARCIVCEAQAYVEVEVYDKEAKKKRVFEMCAHHFKDGEDKLRETAVRIIDHRPWLRVQESAFKGVDAR